VSPAPDSFDGASPVSGPKDQGLPLGVCEVNHLANKYPPGALVAIGLSTY